MSGALMPGALKSELDRHMPMLVQRALLFTLQKDSVHGA